MILNQSYFFYSLFLIAFTLGEVGAVPCRVVLDPGHGGMYISPTRIYGDKFDVQKGHFLDSYKAGARHREIYEHERVYRIGAGVKELLVKSQDPTESKKLKRILNKYGTIKGKVRPIEVHLSRENSYFSRYLSIDEDVNAPYRLFDFPDKRTGKLRKGTISRINDLKPHLVVSLHLTGGNAPKNGAMGSVITPSYRTFSQALQYVHGNKSKRKKIRAQFKASPWKNWFLSAASYGRFEMFLLDSWVYFTGSWSTPSGLEPYKGKFRGLRHNMVSWSYQQPDIAPPKHLKYFKPKGPFWNREKGQAEIWRREDGPEGYGGDNFYASQQLLRYSRKSLIINKVDSEKTAPVLIDPFLSTWSVPTYTNAVSAFLELGYLSNKKDRYRLTNHLDLYIEGLTAGIYSLCYPMNSQKVRLKSKPINWDRYLNYQGKNYFDQAYTPSL